MTRQEPHGDETKVNEFREYIQNNLDKESKKCEYWKEISSRSDIDEELKYRVLAVVGKYERSVLPQLQDIMNKIDKIGVVDPSTGQVRIRLNDLEGLFDYTEIFRRKIDQELKKVKKMLRKLHIPLLQPPMEIVSAQDSVSTIATTDTEITDVPMDNFFKPLKLNAELESLTNKFYMELKAYENCIDETLTIIENFNRTIRKEKSSKIK